MKESHEFLVPDYYLKFACKMGECRSACCVGWPITISMRNYFHLVGLNCPKRLRERLDCGLRVLELPTADEYARFEPRYDGNCPMRMGDGRCSLHAELGEDILPDVCRLYPRGIRAENDSYECSCANSCEAVLELLMDKTDPITFSYQRLTVQMPPIPKRESFFKTFGIELKIRMYLISVIQNRNLPLPQRIIRLGDVLDRIDKAVELRDRAMLDGILNQNPTEHFAKLEEAEVSSEHLGFGLNIVEQMIEILDARSQSIRECGEAALSYFRGGENPIGQYYNAKSHFETLFPNWETFYENVLVNHIFFSQFPFQDRPENFHSEYVALCAVYATLRFLGLGSTAENSGRDGLIDGMAAAFRLIDHTEYDRYASRLLRRLSCISPEQLYDLLSL